MKEFSEERQNEIMESGIAYLKLKKPLFHKVLNNRLRLIMKLKVENGCLKMRENDLQEQMKYLLERDLLLLKLEHQNMNNPEMNDEQQDRYAKEIQEVLNKTGAATLNDLNK